MNIYTENQNDIIHETSVDFVLRPCTKEIHIVQYDKSLPVIKVELFRNGEKYIIPDEAAINIRFGKLDHTFVMKPVLGCNEERTAVYFEVDEQMTVIAGRVSPVLEMVIGSNIAYSSPIGFVIDKNPVQMSDVESATVVYPVIYELIEQVAQIAQKMISITYAALKTLRDNGQLIIGQQYRITDYECTTTKKNTSSAGHVFDIIVVADDVNVLNENARAILHDGDTYFADCNLGTWQLKYCLDNDTARFAWADGSSGKGVIYWLKDEFGNECPYDFKNILFTSNGKYTNAYTFTYTDNGLKDASIVGLSKSCYNNVIKEYHTSITLQLNWNIFRSTSAAFNCYSNTFGNNCYSNTFGNYCMFDTFSNNCNYNRFGNGCTSNTFGNSCNYNRFGNDCASNTFGNSCYSNTFGNSCQSNTFGNSCYSNTFGSYCNYNRFGNSSTVINYCRNNIFDSDCSYIYLSSEDTTASSSNYLQNVHIHLGVTGSSTSNRLSIVVSDRNLAYSIDYYASGSQDIILD